MSKRMEFILDLDTATYEADVDSYMNGYVDPAIAEGMNVTANIITDEMLPAETRDKFDWPNFFTQDAFTFLPVNPANRHDADPTTPISIMPLQARYLNLQVYGGVRRAGDYASLQSGILIPGPDAELDEYGNLPRNYISMALVDPDVFWWRPKDSDKVRLAKRDGDKLKILAIVVDKAEYQPRLDFFGVIERGASQHLAEEISRAMVKRGRSVS